MKSQIYKSIQNSLKFLIITSSLFLTFSLFIINPTRIKAETLSPAIQDLYLSPNQTAEKTIKIKNDTMNIKSYSVKTSRINPENKTILTDQIELLAIPSKYQKFTLNPSEEFEIPYTINVPQEIPSGTYFSLISIETDNTSNNIAVRSAIGSIIAVHITNPDLSLSDILHSKIETKFEVINHGDLINPVKLKLTIQNNSNFTVKPSFSINYNSTKKEDSTKNVANSNLESITIYPGKAYVKEIEIPLWKINNLLNEFKFISVIIINEVKFENQIQLNLINQDSIINIMLIVGGVIGLFILLLLPFKIFDVIKKRRDAFVNSQKKF